VDFHREGKHPYGLSSAHDMGLLLEKIKTGKAVSKAASDQMMGILRGQLYTTRLPKYVTGFRVAHKTGDFLPYVGNDVGVFQGVLGASGNAGFTGWTRTEFCVFAVCVIWASVDMFICTSFRLQDRNFVCENVLSSR
jgi:hypothetical protein